MILTETQGAFPFLEELCYCVASGDTLAPSACAGSFSDKRNGEMGLTNGSPFPIQHNLGEIAEKNQLWA